jgi:hypothetical protein
MARFITRPGPPLPMDGNFTNENEDIDMDSESDDITLETMEESDEEISEISGVAEEDEICLDWSIYGKPIEVYYCLQSPERLAWDIFLWERLENIGIDQCVDVHPDSPHQPESNIPEDAIYVVVGDTVMQNPYGHTALFCRQVKDKKTGYDKYKPIVGFFWSFKGSNSTTVQSISEYFHSRAAPSQLVAIYERIPFQDKVRFLEVFTMITRTVNKEMKALERGRRLLKNTMGNNRHTPTRWRSNVQDLKKLLVAEDAEVIAPPKKEVAPKKKKAAPKRKSASEAVQPKRRRKRRN